MAFQITSTPLFLFYLLLIAGKQLYQFGEGTGDAKLPRIDDKPAVQLSVKFPFYGEMEEVLYVRVMTVIVMYRIIGYYL